MDRRADWPWNSEEEAEWKADLEESDNGFLVEMIDDAVTLDRTGSPHILQNQVTQESAQDETVEKYLVAA